MAIVALGEMGPDARQAIPSLVRLLHDPDERVRRRSILALSQLGPEARTAAPGLIGLLGDPDALVRRWAASALGEIGPTAPAAIPALIDSLADADMKNRAIVIVALGKIGIRAVPHLIAALKHPNATIRRCAARTLPRCTRGQDGFPALTELLRDRDPLVREAAAESLRRIARY